MVEGGKDRTVGARTLTRAAFDEGGEGLADAGEFEETAVEIGQFAAGGGPDGLHVFSPTQGQKFVDLGEGEAQCLGPVNETQAMEGVGLVTAVTGGTAGGSGEESRAFVVADGVDRESGAAGDFTDFEAGHGCSRAGKGLQSKPWSRLQSQEGGCPFRSPERGAGAGFGGPGTSRLIRLAHEMTPVGPAGDPQGGAQE